MKTAIILLTLVIISTGTYSQDQIFLRGRRTLNAKVVEINIDFIKYKKYDNVNGPDYKMSARGIDSIIFENGTVERYSHLRQPPHVRRMAEVRLLAKPTKFAHLKPNSFSAGYWHYTKSSTYSNTSTYNPKPGHTLYLAYEHTFFKNRLAATITPFAVLNAMAYGASIDFKFYPLHSHRFILGLGPRYIFTRQEVERRKYIPADGYSMIETYTANISRLLLDVEMKAHVTEQFFIKVNAGIGNVIGSSKIPKPENTGYLSFGSGNPVNAIGLGIGFRF